MFDPLAIDAIFSSMTSGQKWKSYQQVTGTISSSLVATVTLVADRLGSVAPPASFSLHGVPNLPYFEVLMRLVAIAFKYPLLTDIDPSRETLLFFIF